MAEKKKSKKNEADPFHGDADRGWQYSDAKAALYAAIVDGDIPLALPKDPDEEDDDKLWEYFNLRPEIYNYGGFDKYFRGRLNACRQQIEGHMSRAQEDQIAYEIFKKKTPKSFEFYARQLSRVGGI